MTLRDLRTGQARRSGFSILELLIATTIAMVILLIVTKWFRDLSVNAANSRAMVEMSGQMRAVIAHLENDLKGATFPRGALPGSNSDFGYIQYTEGIATDAQPAWPNLTPFDSSVGAQTIDPPDVTYVNAANMPVTASPVATTTPPLAIYANILGAPIPGGGEEALSRYGDMDDVLSLTTRQMDSPYRGKMLFSAPAIVAPEPPFISNVIESPMAEIVWWVEGLDENGDTQISTSERQIRRRVFLIRPDLSAAIRATYLAMKTAGLSDAQALQVMLEQCDVSFHLEWDPTVGPGGSVVAIANSLADLASHRYTTTGSLPGFPNAMFPVPSCKRITLGVCSRGNLGAERTLNSLAYPKVSHYEAAFRPIAAYSGMTDLKGRFGDDVMLSSVAAFDLRIFDPGAPLWLHAASGLVVSPGDPGYASAAGGTPAGTGAFVDLNYANSEAVSWFSGPPSEFSGFFQVNAAGTTYSTLLTAYDTVSPVKNNTMDGIDSDGNGVVDDPGELAAEVANFYMSPPYANQLRGLQVSVRVYDEDSKQIRQMKASAAFAND